MININKLYRLATTFENAINDNKIVTKQLIFNQFFNAFRDGRYTLLYNYFKSVGADDGLGETYTYNPWGAHVKFRFIDKKNNAPKIIKQEVTTALQASSIGSDIHMMFVEPLGNSLYEVQIQFKNSVPEVL